MKLPVPKGGRSILWTVLSLIAVVCVSPSYSLAQSNVVFSADFETSNIRSGWDWMEACCSHSMNQSFEFSRSGKSSLRVELRKTDGTQGGSKRAELSENNRFPNDPNQRYFAFSHYLPTDFKVDSVREILFQWHLKATSGITLGASPPLSLLINKGRWELNINYDSTDINIYQAKNARSIFFDLGPWEKGKWTDWVIRYDYSAETDGLVQVWKDQKLILEYKGRNFYKGSYPPYFKTGIYKWAWSDTYAKTSKQSILTSRVIYLDRVLVGNKDAKASDFFINPPAVTNQAPTARITTTSSIQLPANSVRLDGSGSSDPDGTIANYQWSQVSGPSTATLTNAATSIATAGGLVAGSYQFRLTITDDKGATATTTSNVTVAAATVANLAPVSNAGANTSYLSSATSFPLNGSGSSDPDGSIQSYAWKQISGPGTSVVSNSAAVTTTVTKFIQGIYKYQLTVTDDKGARSADTVTITIVAASAALPQNKTPIAQTDGNKQIRLPQNSSPLDGSKSSDPDGRISSYIWTQTSGPSTAIISTPTSSGTQVQNLKAGTYTFQLKVTDNGGLSATTSVSVTVLAAYKNPVANAGTDRNLQLPAASIELDGTASSDPNGLALRFSWQQLSGPNTSTLASAGAAKTLASNLVAGTYLYRLTVTNSANLSSSDTMKLVVLPIPENKAPIAVIQDSMLSNSPWRWALNGAGSYDTDGSIASFSWAFISGPVTPTFLSPSGVATEVTNLIAGTYKFRLSITDNMGKSTVKEHNLIITDSSTSAPKELLEVRFWPNPVNDILKVRITGNAEGYTLIRIFDLTGTKVLEQVHSKFGKVLNLSIPVQRLSAGMYFLNIKVGNRPEQTEKFIKN